MNQSVAMMTPTGKIRVLHLIRSIGFGGAENQVVQILNGLDPKWFAKYLITFKHEEVPNFANLHDEIHYSVIPRRRLGHIQCVCQLARFLRDHKIDIVQAHLFQSNLFAAIAARISNRPIVLTTEHGKNLWKKKVHHFIENTVISRLVDKRIAVSEDIRQIRIGSRDIPENKIVVIPPCVPLPGDPARIRKNEEIKIVTVGRLVAAKNYVMLLRSIRLLVDNGIRASLAIIGDGPDKENLAAWVERHNLSDHVDLLGFRTDIIDLLRGYDIFALSSIREGTPVAMLEAMALGLPVVATQVGGIPDVLGNNERGLIVPPNDPEQMCNALKTLCLNPDLRASLGKSARALITSTYSQAAICGQYEKLYFDMYTLAFGGNRK
jgi:glycosyltransferase involved in cell wall biosynthesis